MYQTLNWNGRFEMERNRHASGILITCCLWNKKKHQLIIISPMNLNVLLLLIWGVKKKIIGHRNIRISIECYTYNLHKFTHIASQAWTYKKKKWPLDTWTRWKSCIKCGSLNSFISDWYQLAWPTTNHCSLCTSTITTKCLFFIFGLETIHREHSKLELV